MKKTNIYILWTVLSVILSFSTLTHAGECVVDNDSGSASKKGSLTYLINDVYNKGACKSSNSKLTARYSDYIKSGAPYHVIRFTKSAEVYAGKLPDLHGREGIPLVIIADGSATVRVLGGKESGIVIGGSGGSVVLDNISVEGFGDHGIRIESNDNLLMGVKIKENGFGGGRGHGIYILGKGNAIVNSHVSGSGGDGIVVGNKLNCGVLNNQNGNGDETLIYSSVVESNGKKPQYNNDGIGIYINADNVKIDSPTGESRVISNRLTGVFIESNGRACDTSEYRPRKAIVSRTTFGSNGKYFGDSGVSIVGNAIPTPEGVANISDPNDLDAKIFGNYPHASKKPFWLINPSSVEVDVYKANSSGEPIKYIGRAKGVDVKDGSFVISVEDKAGLAVGALVAIANDLENWQTSKPSGRGKSQSGIVTPKDNDIDGDGLIDSDEERYGTDPLNPDSDLDGLTDGEEIALKTDPNNPDSDGDCLPDGLELGVGLEKLEALRGPKLATVTLGLGEACSKILKDHNVLILKNAILIDEGALHRLGNVSALYDSDSSTTTDPLNADSDGDGTSDGQEDWNFSGSRDMAENKDEYVETDPLLTDSDGDNLIDGDEGDRNGNGILDYFESSPLLADTDNDGLADDEENRRGTYPNSCDSDNDGLGDGLESGIIHPLAKDKKCRGLQTAGSNFMNIDMLNPTSKDSDGDGIPDGEEDKNANGWLDRGETDPTTNDSDGDLIDDYIEMTGDIDGDGTVDIDPYLIKNGPECSPPVSISDVDCDGIPNAVDIDSDNDGCLDREESLEGDANMDGIPDPFDAKSAACGTKPAPSSAPSGMASVGSSGGSPESPAESDTYLNPRANIQTGGGSCSLVGGNRADFGPIIVLLLSIGILIKKRGLSNEEKGKLSQKS